VGLFLVVLLVAFLVSKSCGSVGDEVSQEEAVEIARAEIGFDAEHHQIRLFKKGLDSHPYWGVSLYDGDRTNPTQCQVVQIDAQSGDVASVEDC
jgi:Peptidase propeptide and YPEB domain